MTEEEKRRIALEFFESETARLQQKTHSVLDTQHDRFQASMTRIQKKAAMFDSLAQNGITWHDLKAAYDESFKRGHDAMIDFKLSFFYASVAIALKERFDPTPDQCASFIHQLLDIAEEYTDKPSLLAASRDTAGIDTTPYDQDGIPTAPGRASMTSTAKATPADVKAVARMKKAGITPADLEYEKSVGYEAGWNSGFGYSVCYAALVLALYRVFQSTPEEIGSIYFLNDRFDFLFVILVVRLILFANRQRFSRPIHYRTNILRLGCAHLCLGCALRGRVWPCCTRKNLKCPPIHFMATLSCCRAFTPFSISHLYPRLVGLA